MLFTERENHNGNGSSSSNLRTLAMVSHSYARSLLETRLSSRLKTPVRVETGSLQFGAFDDFRARIDSPSSLCSFIIGHRHRAAVEINQSLAFSIVDLLMGGRGYPPVETRPLSPLEQNLLGGVFESLGRDFGKAWQQLVPHTWNRAQEAQFTYSLDGFYSQEKMLLIVFEIGIGELAQGVIQLAIPLSAIQPAQQAIQSPDMRGDALIEDNPLTGVLPMALDVILPPTEMTVEQLLAIDVGDVLEFSDWEVSADEDHSIEVVVCVEGRPRHRGKLGVMGTKKTVEITGNVDADDYPEFSD